MSKDLDPSLLRGLRAQAISSGGWATSPISTFWDIAGRCDFPVTRQLQALAGGQLFGVSPDNKRQYLDVRVPCRKCGPCLSYRSYLWRTRSKYEILQSSRSWFCTYTIRPDNRVWFKSKASLHVKENIDRMTEAKAFSAVYAEIGKEFTKYLKRIRKQSGAKLRFLLVAEVHKDGFPHLHALIHEVDKPITKAVIQDQWPHGFTTAKLCDIAASNYVTKYIAKQALARVRASLHYGHPSSDIADNPQGLEACTSTLKKRSRAEF